MNTWILCCTTRVSLYFSFASIVLVLKYQSGQTKLLNRKNTEENDIFLQYTNGIIFLLFKAILSPNKKLCKGQHMNNCTSKLKIRRSDISLITSPIFHFIVHNSFVIFIHRLYSSIFHYKKRSKANRTKTTSLEKEGGKAVSERVRSIFTKHRKVFEWSTTRQVKEGLEEIPWSWRFWLQIRRLKNRAWNSGSRTPCCGGKIFKRAIRDIIPSYSQNASFDGGVLLSARITQLKHHRGELARMELQRE